MEKQMSNVKSKKFYAEADEMQQGWGKYLKSIDILKDSVDDKKDITLNDACWILYGEGHCSGTWESFKVECIRKGWKNKKMPWDAWKGIFDVWNKERTNLMS